MTTNNLYDFKKHDWRVVKSHGQWIAHWRINETTTTYWHFKTQAEALAYADRKARTREVVLPRPQFSENGKVEFDFTEWAGLDYELDMPGGVIYDRRTGPNNLAFGASVWIPREHWRPLAAALWALAEQEGQA